MVTAYVLAVVLKDGFAHKTQRQVACKILLLQTVAVAVAALVTAAMAECLALITLLRHAEVKEVEEEVGGYLIHIHKEHLQSSKEWIGHIDLQANEKVEVGVEGPLQQMRFVIG